MGRTLAVCFLYWQLCFVVYCTVDHCSILPIDMFDEAQKHVYGVMEGTLHRRFLFSEDGLQYLESVVRRDIEKRRQSVRVYVY